MNEASTAATTTVDTWTLACGGCGARYPQHTREYLDLRPQQAFAEQTKYLDEALHADARHERVSTPLLGSGIRQRQLRKFLKLAPGDKVIDLGCGSGRSLLWNAASGATFVGTDVAPFFAKEARDRMPLALGDLRQLPFPDGTFTKAYALDVLEHLSPEALDAMLKEAARILAPGGVLFVYSHVRKNSPLAIGLKTINRFARVLERAGLIDMTQERLRKSDHLNPLRDVPHLEQVAATAGFSIARIRYYTPLVGGFVENIMMRVAERAMTKRAARKLAASHTPHPPAPLSPGTSGERGIKEWAPDGPTQGGDHLASEAIKQARTQAKARIAREGPVYWALRGLTVAMETDMVLFGRIRTGPFFALLRKEPAAAQRFVDASHGRAETRLRAAMPVTQVKRARERRRNGVMQKIVYCATDQTVPGTKGGSTHVLAVAEGLAVLGNEVHVAAQPGAGGFPADGVHWHAIGAPLGKPALRMMRTFAVDRLIRQVRPDIIIERYHNFGGESLRSGGWHVLEVNAPIVDYPNSPKQRLDRALLIEPFRRWRDWQCRTADRFVVPTRAILPDWIPAEKIHETEWGVDTNRFRPAVQPPPGVKLPFTRDGRLIVIFIGAFRAWHGVRHLVRAMKILHDEGRATPDAGIHAVLIGDGPEREPAEAEARAAGLDAAITFTGALPHELLPACLAAADIGVAPFDTAAHAPLSLAFYWSPLKVFEYMAAALPVVAPDIPRLRQILGAGEAGLLYDAANPRGLADAIVALAEPERRAALGVAARARAERDYSWMSHCERLMHAVTPPSSRS